MNILEGLDVLWWGHTTVDIAWDEDFLNRMQKSGCIAVNIGFESLSQENLKSMNKSFAGASDYREAIKRIHEHKIGIMGTFVVGFVSSFWKIAWNGRLFLSAPLIPEQAFLKIWSALAV